MKKKRALICGISGQDGAYLARLLIRKGYTVIGTSRDAQMSTFANLHHLGVFEKVEVDSMSVMDFRSVLQTLKKSAPDEVYNLAGQSSVGLSFHQPVETLESISVGTINLLEAIRFLEVPIRFYNAASSECFGDTGGVPAHEKTQFRPRSPYAVAKATSFWQVANYREAYNIHACSGILFNHESPLRPERFVTKKIVAAACRIANGSNERLKLGNTSIRRDWGWAPEYVEAMWKMLQMETVDDYVIGTGTCYALSEFVNLAFDELGLCAKDHVETDSSLLRPTDIAIGVADPSKAKERMGWEAKYGLEDVVKMMVKAEKTGDVLVELLDDEQAR